VRPGSLTRSQVFDLIDHIQTFQTASSSTGTTKRFSFRDKAEVQHRSNQIGECDSIQVDPEHDSGVRGDSPVEATPGDGLAECVPSETQSGAALGNSLAEAMPSNRLVEATPANDGTSEAAADATPGEAVFCNPAHQGPEDNATDDGSNNSPAGGT
jgi:hypothetical protein